MGTEKESVETRCKQLIKLVSRGRSRGLSLTDTEQRALGARLRTVRGKRSMKSMGEEVCLSQSYLSKIELGNATPQPAAVRAICQAESLSPCWLVYGVGPAAVAEPLGLRRSDGGDGRHLFVAEDVARIVALTRKVMATDSETGVIADLAESFGLDIERVTAFVASELLNQERASES